MIYLMFLAAFALSAIAAWYAVTGLMAIFAAAAVSIAIMGCALEISKLVVASWVYRNWNEAPKMLKIPFVAALIILMTLTSMGIFGYLSKAHIDQGVPTENISAQVSLLDEKIKNEKEIINESRKSLAQLDTQINETIARTSNDTTDKGVRRAIAARKAQARERAELRLSLETSQKKIASYQEARAPIASQLRQVEAEVGPIKYIAALIYGDVLDQSLLEKAVRIVIIMIVIVFDPLAVLMLIAANWSLKNRRKDELDLTEFANNLAEKQEDLGPEANKILHDNLWDLYEESPKEEFKDLEPTHDEPKVEHAYLNQPWAWTITPDPNPQDEKPLEYDSHGRLMTVPKPAIRF